MKPQVICLPGGVAPAAQRYAPLKDLVHDDADLHLKDLEVYRDEKPPSVYAVEDELADLDRFADSLGLDHFHLVGYSGGGFISLAYAGTRRGRLLSLGLFEPAMIPGEMTAEESAYSRELQTNLDGLGGAEFMTAFVRAQVKPGVQLAPPPASPPPGMQKRPAGIAAMMQAFFAFQFDRERFRECAFPVYFGYGDLTAGVDDVKAGVLASNFSDIRVQRFKGVHHFVPPEQIYTREHSTALEELWQRGEDRAREGEVLLA